MTRQQVEWAKQHDWFMHAFDTFGMDGWRVQVCGSSVGPDGQLYCETETFTSFQALRAWAGY